MTRAATTVRCMLNKLHLNNVHCDSGGMYVTGLKTGGMLLYNGERVQMAVELPQWHAQRTAFS